MGINVGSSEQSGSLLGEINVTPFVDVMLVLLVIFMVTAPMISRGVQVNLPRTRAAVMEVDESKLLLVVSCSNTDPVAPCGRRVVQLGEQEVPPDRLEIAIRTNERLQLEREVYLQADRRVPYGFVVHVMAILREAGVDRLGIVTDPLEQTGEAASAEAQEEE
jgi:biopolymer transport protein TolR